MIGSLRNQAFEFPIIAAEREQNLILTYTYSEQENSIMLLLIKEQLASKLEAWLKSVQGKSQFLKDYQKYIHFKPEEK